MLNVIFLILKIIGIILLVLLGILIFLITSVLVVPVRYEIIAKKYEEISVKVRLSWMLRLIYVGLSYEKSKLLFKIRIIGIPIYNSGKPRKKKTKKARKTKIKKVKEKDQAITNKVDVKEEETETKEYSQQPVDAMQSNTTSEEKQSDDHVLDTDTKKGMKNRLKQIIDMIKNVLFGEENRAAFGIILQTIKDLLNHSRPKIKRGEVEFGCDDPATTGQVVGIISCVYAYFSPKRFSILPNFEENKLEGYIDLVGRVRTFTVTRIVIKLLRDKNFKAFRKRINQFKEES